MRAFDHLRKRLLDRAGLGEQSAGPRYKLADLERSEWSTRFERLMRNRLIMGALRYGLLHKPAPNYDSVASIVRRAEAYGKTGNQELLVDIANLALVEFVRARHPNAHFSSVDDGEHVTIKPKNTNE